MTYLQLEDKQNKEPVSGFNMKSKKALEKSPSPADFHMAILGSKQGISKTLRHMIEIPGWIYVISLKPTST